MSKHFAAILLIFPLILELFNNCPGQTTEVVISVRSVDAPTAELQGRTVGITSKNFSILRDYAGISDLADRVSNIVLEDREGKSVAFKQFIPGEYVADREFARWRYFIDLAPRKHFAAAAHTSWISADHGLLFLDDLLPLGSTKAGNEVNVQIRLPMGWSATSESFETDDAGKVVVLVSKQARMQQVSVGDSTINVVNVGQWLFTDTKAADFVKQIFNEYRKSFGELPEKKASVYIVPFPKKVDLGNWEGDTRGNTVTIVSSDMPFETQSVQRLHEQLRHEIFHLWFPNALTLTGNYDWFYEGFALYRSLRLGVALNRLRFDDYLDTLGRATTIDSMLTDRRSLLDASSARVSGAGDTIIYARGMLAAFLTDIQTLRRSGGKDDVSTILRAIYEKHSAPAVPEVGNTAVLRTIDLPAVTRFVSSGERVDWANELKPIGIEVVRENGVATLRVAAGLTSSQKKFLDKLGYNNWRKLAPSPK